MVDNKFSSEFAKIQSKFLDKLKIWASDIKVFSDKLIDDTASAEDIEQIKALFHKLAGSAKTFGYSAINDVSAKIEESLEKIEREKTRDPMAIEYTSSLLDLFFKLCVITYKTNTDISGSAMEAPAENVKKDYTILAVDDDELIHNLLQYSLGKENYNIVPLEDGNRFFEVIESCKPDLIILDVNMPGLNGMVLLKLLKAEDKYQHIPVIMLTKRDGARDMMDGYSSGAIDYITKPFDTTELANKIIMRLKTISKKVLIADSSETIVEELTRKFYKKGYAVLKCYDGEKAINRIKAEKPDLIILDLALPNADGFVVLNNIKAHADTALIPVIILAAERQNFDIHKAMEQGAADYITKPLNIEEVALKVGKILR